MPASVIDSSHEMKARSVEDITVVLAKKSSETEQGRERRSKVVGDTA